MTLSRFAPALATEDGQTVLAIGEMERCWRLLLMIVEDDTLRAPQMRAEMGPLLEQVPQDQRDTALRRCLAILHRAGLIEPYIGQQWRGSVKGKVVVAKALARGGVH